MVAVMDLKRAEQILTVRDRAQRKRRAKRRTELSLVHAIHGAVREHYLSLEQIKLEFGSPESRALGKG